MCFRFIKNSLMLAFPMGQLWGGTAYAVTKVPLEAAVRAVGQCLWLYCRIVGQCYQAVSVAVLQGVWSVLSCSKGGCVAGLLVSVIRL